MERIVKIVKLITLASLIAGFFLIYTPAFAQEELKITLEQIADKIELIKEIKNDDELNWAEKDEKETILRKEILFNIFQLTILENNDLKGKLESLDNLIKEEDDIKTALIKALDENTEIFNLMQLRLEEANSLYDIKNLANEFNNWRSLVYNPKVENIITFTIVFRQKNILEIAENRLEKIKEDLNNLENADLLKDGEVDELLQNAISKIEEAKTSNEKAEKNMITYLNRKLFSKIKFGISYFISSSSVKDSVNESLDQVRDAYSIFIEIGRSAKEKVGIN